MTTVDDAVSWLVAPASLRSRDEVLARPCPVPAAAGVYAWHFDELPSGVPADGCERNGPWTLLYVGISPKATAIAGRPSRQNLRSRVRYHYRGNAAGSTLRLSLGVLLADTLGIQLRRVGSGGRLTFSDGEARLSAWMADHARVSWLVTDQPWVLERQLIQQLALPLNLAHNSHHGFHVALTAARASRKALARSLPILPR